MTAPMNLTKGIAVFLAGLIALMGASFVRAEPVADAFKALQTAVEKETSKMPPARAHGEEGEADTATMIIAELRLALDRDDEAQMQSILNQLPMRIRSQTVRVAADKLRLELRTRKEARDKVIVAKLETIFANAKKKVETATKARDLDELLGEFTQLQNDTAARNYDAVIRAQLSKGQSMRRFVVSWQDYLFYRDAGDAEKAIQKLQNLADNEVLLLPRSDILARVDELTKSKAATPEGEIVAIMAKTKNLADIPAAVSAISDYLANSRRSTSDNTSVFRLRDMLAKIWKTYQEYEAGLPTQLEVKPSIGYPGDVPAFQALLHLHAQLLRELFPRYLNVDESLMPKPDEPAATYLDRVMTAAFERGDMRLLVRVCQLQDSLGEAHSAGVLGTLQTVLAAENQQAAGQFVPAVISYQTALKIGGDVIPAKVIGARLDAIKAAHPTEFAEGMTKFLNGESATVVPTDGNRTNLVNIPGRRPSSAPSASSTASPSR